MVSGGHGRGDDPSAEGSLWLFGAAGSLVHLELNWRLN